jgi:hypothetical protein
MERILKIGMKVLLGIMTEMVFLMLLKHLEALAIMIGIQIMMDLLMVGKLQI